MSTYDLVCKNCKHQFKHESYEGVVCPACGWTSSVVRLEEYQDSSRFEKKPKKEKRSLPIVSTLVGFAFFLLKTALWLALFLAILYGGWFGWNRYRGTSTELPEVLHFKKWTAPFESSDSSGSFFEGVRKTWTNVAGKGSKWVGEMSEKFSNRSKEEMVDLKPDFKDPSSSKTIEEIAPPKEPVTVSEDPPTPKQVSEKDLAILNRRVEFKAEDFLTDRDREVLNYTVDLDARISGQIPSAAWTVEQFEKLVEDQENLYKIKLSRKYKKKLMQHFSETYVLANEAFIRGDLYRARDLWVVALAVPQYSDDISRHRGVVLTMLRTYINDTLSKIDHLNQTLLAQKPFDQQAGLNVLYDSYLQRVRSYDWTEAQKAESEIQDFIKQLSSSAPTLPPYPVEAQNIDRDIRSSLDRLVGQVRPSVQEEYVKQDLMNKSQAISRMHARYSQVKKGYDEGLDAVRQKLWDQALTAFEKIKGDEKLMQDVHEKTKILKGLL